MLSILIPTYNYNVYPLVKILKEQCDLENIVYDISVYDDCSNKIEAANNKINSLKNCSYKYLEKNIGRSAIRNLLAREATYEILLFLDADTLPKKKNFINKYINSLKNNTEIIYGGIEYQKSKPDKKELLRWVYGKKREALTVSERTKNKYLRFLTLNFIIKKSVFSKIHFNEEILNYGHEDTLFALEAKKNNIKILHIDNIVLHLGLENSRKFLKKSKYAIDVLKELINNGFISPKQITLSKYANSIIQLGLRKIFLVTYNIFNKLVEKNLLSNNPSLFIFDIYRLAYYLNKK